MVTSASETTTSSGGAANDPSRSSSGHSMVCSNSTPSFGRQEVGLVEIRRVDLVLGHELDDVNGLGGGQRQVLEVLRLQNHHPPVGHLVALGYLGVGDL